MIASSDSEPKLLHTNCHGEVLGVLYPYGLVCGGKGGLSAGTRDEARKPSQEALPV